MKRRLKTNNDIKNKAFDSVDPLTFFKRLLAESRLEYHDSRYVGVFVFFLG